MALKLDMSKAYDHVKWAFLKTVMRKIGFDERWIGWIMACVSLVSFSILLNGELVGSFKPTRRIRQGDPFSPYLFILCAEGLSSFVAGSSKWFFKRGAHIPKRHLVKSLVPCG